MVMRQAGHDRHGLRVRALIAVLWRAGLRISEALALAETDIDADQGSVLVRHGKGDKRRETGMDLFGFQQLAAWEAHRMLLPPGPLFCVIDGATRGRRWSATAARHELRELAASAGVRHVSRRTSFAMPMRSNSPTRASQSTSSSVSSVTPIWGRPRTICRASTPARSSMPPLPPPTDDLNDRRPGALSTAAASTPRSSRSGSSQPIRYSGLPVRRPSGSVRTRCPGRPGSRPFRLGFA